MKVLLSAYACEPNRGSEPGVGWNWALEIVKRGHEVVVITRKNNRNVIDNVNDKPKNLSFIYYDLPKSLMWLKKAFGVHVYYLFWQIGIYIKIKRELGVINPDIIHHITFVAIRKLSFLSFLGKPFYYGPLGGGETCPKELLKGISNKYLIKESLRNLLNKFIRFNPCSHLILKKARLIFTTTEESKQELPNFSNNKTYICPAIGLNSVIPSTTIRKDFTQLKILYVGQFIYWKGIQIALDSLSILKEKNIEFTFTLVGKGEFEFFLKEKALKQGISEHLNWINWLPQDELATLYDSHDVFLFPSLHDSGGMVVLEAMSHGLPIICLDLGGPGYFVNDSIGYKIDVSKKQYETVVSDFSEALFKLNNNRELLNQKSKAAFEKSKEYSWTNTVDNVYTIIESDFIKNQNN